MSDESAVVCPSEYGPPAGIRNGIARSFYGECVCAKLGFTPCAYDSSARRTDDWPNMFGD